MRRGIPALPPCQCNNPRGSLTLVTIICCFSHFAKCHPTPTSLHERAHRRHVCHLPSLECRLSGKARYRRCLFSKVFFKLDAKDKLKFLDYLSKIAPVTLETEKQCAAYAWFRSAEDNDVVPHHWLRGLEV